MPLVEDRIDEFVKQPDDRYSLIIIDRQISQGYVTLEELREADLETLMGFNYTKVKSRNILRIIQLYIARFDKKITDSPSDEALKLTRDFSVLSMIPHERKFSPDDYKVMIRDWLLGKRKALTPQLARSLIYTPTITDNDVADCIEMRDKLSELTEERDELFRQKTKLNTELNRLRKIHDEKKNICVSITSLVNEFFTQIRNAPPVPEIKSDVKKLLNELEPFYNGKG
uniref:Antirepressor n=1 Tax=Rhabditophanes sp. KR3021 TaxID=114890 RepID=A0AC35TGP7_9BILA